MFCWEPNTLGKGYFALGKAFARCSTRQRAVNKDFFAGSFLSGTRQRLCQEQTRAPTKQVVVMAPASSALALPGAMSEAPNKVFLIFFPNFLLLSAWRGGSQQRFFYFFNSLFVGCPGPGTCQSWEFWRWGIPSFAKCQARAPGKASNYLFIYTITTNTIYHIFISQTQYSTPISSQTQSHINISRHQYNISHTRHRKHNRSNIHRHKSIVVHSASHVHQAMKKRNKLEGCVCVGGGTECVMKEKHRRLRAPEIGYSKPPTEAT